MNSKFYMKTRVCNHEKQISLSKLKEDLGLNYCKACIGLKYRIQYKQVLELLENK